MSQTYYTIITNLGAALFAQATVLGKPLQLTHLAIGDGNGHVPIPEPTQTSLVNEVRRGAINTIYIDENNANHIIVEQVIPPEEGGFYVRELGLFDENGNLIAIGNCPPSYKPKLAEGSGRTQVINMVILVDNTGTVALKIDATSVLATRKYVDDLIVSTVSKHESSTNHPDASTLNKGLVQLSSAINSESETQAATLKSVKIAYDAAVTAQKTANNCLSIDGGVVTGNTHFNKSLQVGGFDVVTKETVNNYLPVGIPQAWPQLIPPAGWISCDGRKIDKETYPKLAQIYTRGYLPDLRGEFIRGLDNGRNIDPGRELLSQQRASRVVQEVSADADNIVTPSLNSHETLCWDYVENDTAKIRMAVVNKYPHGGGIWNGSKPYQGGTRPRNIAFLMIVRAE